MLNDTILANLTKTYADKNYRHTALLRHKGSLIAFTMDDQRRVFYAVLDQNPANANSPLDVSLWPGGPTELIFPNEIAEIGFGIADQTLLPTYQNGSQTPVKPGIRLADRDKDFFRSTTARLTADAPFQVLSDGRYIYLFRQAIDASHADQIFKQDKDNQPVLDKNGKPVPLVDATLLLDRFVLVGTKLEPRLEVRFQRSRSKTRPASRKDSLGAKDLDGNDFFEPTQELKFVGNLSGGHFSVLLLPTAVAEVERWQIFTQNRTTGRIDAFNVERSADGLFNTRGSQVFAPTKEGHAESALKLENAGDHIALSKGVTLGEAFTFEGWILPEQTQSTQSQVLISGAKSGANAGGPAILVAAQTRIRVDFGSGQGDKFTSKSILTPNIWNHVAVTFDGSAFRFYIGGHLRDKIDLATNDEKPPAKPVLFLGAAQNSFKGTLDEIRLWNRARSSRELQADLNQRLTGLEPGLAGYWRFDESAGDAVFDQTNNGADGELKGGTWVTSDAPIGENAGVNRNTFQIVSRTSDGKLEPREVVSGLTALLYFQQSKVPSGYDGQEKPLKQTARVMLAFATKGMAAGDKNYIASLDFGVSASGKIAHAPDRLALNLVNPDPTKSSVNEQLDAVKAAEEQVRVLTETVKKAEKKRAARKSEYDDLVAQSGAATAKISATETDGTPVLLIQPIGQITFETLNQLGVNDRVHALEIPEQLQVTVFEHNINVGLSKIFTETNVNLAEVEMEGQPGQKWSQIISGIVVAENPAFSGKIAKAEQRLLQAQSDLAAQQVLLTDAQAALAALESTLRNGSEVEMPAVHLDASGLSISGGLLGFAWTDSAPLLFDSATGSLALYFRGADDQFFAAYYTTLTEKAKYPLVDRTGNQAVVCVARSADLGMDKIVVEVSDSERDDACTVKISGLEIEEIWTKVPRDPERFARVLNGQAGHFENGKLVGYRELVGSGFLENGLLKLDAPGLRRALEKGSSLMLGVTRLIVKEAVAKDALEIPIAGIPVSVSEKLPLYFMEYDYAANASTTRVPGDLFGGSLLLRAVSLVNLPGLLNLNGVANQRVTSGATLTSKWTAAAPGSTLLFNGTDTLARLESNSKLKQFDVEADLTLEAWLRPSRVEEKSRIIQHKSANSSYTLGLQKKELNSALAFDGTDDFIELGQGVTVGTPFTLEAWIYPEAADDEFHGFLGGGEILSDGATRAPSLWIVEKNKIHGGFGDGTNWHSVITNAVLTTEEWNHVAATFDGVWYRIFVNGVLALETKSFEGKIPKNEPIRLIGKVDNFFPGKMDDVRVWKRARTQADILADMNRRLVGNETDLVGYWHFENGQARDYSRNTNDGVLHGNPAQAVSPLPAYAVFAGVNGKFVQSKDVMPAGNWTHFAAVFQQNYGLKFDGTNAHLDCGKDESLNINTDLTIEAFLRPGQFMRGRGIITRDTGGDSKQKIPYSLALNGAGQLVFSFQEKNGATKTFTSNAAALPNQSTRVAATRKRETRTYKISDSEIKTLTWFDIRLHVGNATESFVYAADENTRLAVEEIKKTSPNASVVRAGSDSAPEIGRSNGNTFIGRDANNFFNGVISEIRVWNTGRANADIGQEIGGGEEGLVSWWRFEEREGARANDSNGQNHAALNGNIEWVKDDDPQRSGLTLYRNDGGTLETENLDSAGFATAQNQFALGALANSTTQELFNGELEEVRIWKTPRTREQIEDNLFRRLNGEFDDLIAYYTFDAEQDNKLTDNALRGNHLQVQGTVEYDLSTAPVGDDAPMVRSALAGVRTPFSGFIQSTPAVHEYGDMQSDSRGNLIGVFKRCYGFIQNDHLKLLTGYKVGDLAVEWIGQVQFAPQLIGFIEGAPPVPSENLTQPSVEMIGDLDDYNEASTVEFAQSDETTYTYSASKEQGFGLEVEAALKFGIKSVSSAGGGLGVIAITSMEEANVLIGLKAQFEAMWSWQSEASVGTTRTTGKTTSLELRGRYTSPEESANEPFGWRRFVPENTGLALVQSETADVFALRLKHNNALISFTMRPNPDIPKDWNILHFPINPQYVKQGVLDGKIGPVADVDFPSALTYSNDVSYFKPVEAYALKNKIQKAEKELETYYSQFNAADKGRKAYFPSESALELTEQEELKKKLRRNLVNTYVWTADGGLFAETQQTMEMQSETSGGSYEFTGKGGIDLGINFAIAKAAASFELSALFVGQHKLNITKSKESKTSFQLGVSLGKVERDIYMRDEDKIVLLDKTDPKRPKPVKHPYKVDAYRFMSFFLEENSDHFDLFFNKIVDPVWIEQSDNPAAQALREARQEGKKPACWRIMHRVTYVSRVLPPLDEAAPPSLEKALQTLDIESNYELIKQLEPYVSGKLGSFAEFTEAVRQTIERNLPELQPHTAEVIQYMSQYFGIVDGQMPDGEQFGETTLSELAPNQPPIVNAGLDQIIGLDGASVAADLEAVVIDDRLEKAEAIFVTWQKIAGEGDVVFEKPHEAKTKATFTKRGRYTLRCSANDGLLEASDEVVVIVDVPPVISAGADQEILTAVVGVPASNLEALLAGIIHDNGLGNGDEGLSRMSINWSKSSILGAVAFGDNTELDTKATFSTRGHYLLKLSVSNGTFTVSDEVLIAVAARSTRQLEALYTFEENSGTTIRDVSAAGVPLDLVAADASALQWTSGGLKLKKPVLLATEASATRLIDSIKTSNEISIEAWFKPAALNVNGLARILTLSGGATTRNFTLGQSGANFHLGLRSTTTDNNASNKALAAGQTANALTHLVCTRSSDGKVKMYLDGAEIASRAVNGNFSNWDGSFRLALGDEIIGVSDGIERAWLGEYYLVAIYSRALSEQEVLQNFQFGADANLPPIAYSGENQIIDWQNIVQSKIAVALQGRVANDRPQETLNIQWAQVGGPGAPDGVVFQNKNQPATTAEFSQKGRYTLRLTADDGQLMTSSETTVIVHRPPTVALKVAKHKVALTGSTVTTDLIAEIPDDGWGDDMNPANVTYKWSRVSGPDTLQISDSDKLQAKATFSARGLYQLKLEVSNGRLTTVSEFAVTVNQKSAVNAGPNQIGTLPTTGTNPFVQLNLNGQATDTGLGNPADKLNFKWEQLSGPKGGTAEFGDLTKLQTTAKFTVGGVYVLRLTATNPDNPELTASSEMTVTANRAPVVDAGPDPAPLLLKLSSSLFVTTRLDATVSDDGLPDPPGVLALKWTKVGGPANVTFSPDNADYTEAKFVQKGKYTLRLEANDGAVVANDQVTVIVNTPPIVKAGPPQNVTVTGNNITLQLKGEIVDKGLGDETPQSVVATKWEKKSGPGNPVFANANVLETGVTLPNQKGVYILQLRADNGSDVGLSTVQVVVNQPPAVETFVFETDPPHTKKRLLSVQVQSDGLGNPQQDVLTFSWKKLTGAGQATFVPDPNNAQQTTVTFSAAGSYTLELTVGNGSGFTVKKTVTVTVG